MPLIVQDLGYLQLKHRLVEKFQSNRDSIVSNQFRIKRFWVSWTD